MREPTSHPFLVCFLPIRWVLRACLRIQNGGLRNTACKMRWLQTVVDRAAAEGGPHWQRVTSLNHLPPALGSSYDGQVSSPSKYIRAALTPKRGCPGQQLWSNKDRLSQLQQIKERTGRATDYRCVLQRAIESYLVSGRGQEWPHGGADCTLGPRNHPLTHQHTYASLLATGQVLCWGLEYEWR